MAVDRTRARSSVTVDGPERLSHRAMYRAVGLTDDDFKRPIIGVANAAAEVTPCNVHLDLLAVKGKEGIREAGAVPIEFRTITVSDAIAMGHEGMKGSLISREIIADSVEVVCFAERFDALLAIGACDKNVPGMLMAACRLDIPTVILYGGCRARPPSRRWPRAGPAPPWKAARPWWPCSGPGSPLGRS
jgi:dihydroxy-acid dehydratase